MKSLLALWQTVAEELAARCHTSTQRDFETLAQRFEHEGLSFLTITLTDFGKGLEKGLSQGYVSSSDFPSFRTSRGLPTFLSGFLSLIFERGSGRLLDVPSSDAIFAVRQLTLMFGKIEVPCTEDRVQRAFDGFIKCEQELRVSDASRSPSQGRRFAELSWLLFGDVLDSMNRDVREGRIVGSHGPGKTAERVVGNEKFLQPEWPSRLERVFPYLDHALPNPRYYKHLEDIQFLEPGAERPVRVVTVPKTLKTPRIIAIEPVAMQYMQQGLLRPLVEYLETDPLVSGMLGFSENQTNHLMAEEGSRSGKFATLDLSEASDRVSNQLVRSMLQPWPDLFEAVDATRSRKADVQGEVVRLAKFASMGSALCFPVEAMIFLTSIFYGIEQQLSRRLTRQDIKSFRGLVRVFGDDIIVPEYVVSSVIESLETFGFKVNHNKSFWSGKFRESCGKEYYDGDDVSICRVRRLLPASRRDTAEVVSLVALRNNFYKLGLWATARTLDGWIVGVLPHFPTVKETSPLLGRHTLLGVTGDRMCDKLHKPLVRGYAARNVIPRSPLDDHYALVKHFTKRGELPNPDVEHLQRSGRPEAVDIKLRWGPVQ